MIDRTPRPALSHVAQRQTWEEAIRALTPHERRTWRSILRRPHNRNAH